MKPIPQSFFERKTLLAAQDLLGKTLVRKEGNKILREQITEVEAYIGPHDLACHASKGRTARTEIMFKEAGTIYVYLIYGMYWMLNVVTEERDYPAAILIRGTSGARGPGKVAERFNIDKSLNGMRLGKESGLWIEEGPRGNSKKILRTPRIGVKYAGDAWAKKPYRFVLLLPKQN